MIFYVTTAVPCRFIWWLAFFVNKVFLKYVHFKRHNAIAYLTDLQYSVETTFICTGKQKKLCDSWYLLYCGGLELNSTIISKVCLYLFISLIFHWYSPSLQWLPNGHRINSRPRVGIKGSFIIWSPRIVSGLSLVNFPPSVSRSPRTGKQLTILTIFESNASVPLIPFACSLLGTTFWFWGFRIPFKFYFVKPCDFRAILNYPSTSKHSQQQCF